MATFISHSPQETEALGEACGLEAESGMVIALSGELGAGKTQFVKGLARGLGITTRVYSPSFALVNEYGGGRLPLFHLDLYRLETTKQIEAAGLDEYLRAAGVTAIEWAEKWMGLKTERRMRNAGFARRLRWVQIAVVNETERSVTYEDSGA
jgi:tRNA threonylcarbamoyladenosine biosynthesis protein TsaE